MQLQKLLTDVIIDDICSRFLKCCTNIHEIIDLYIGIKNKLNIALF